MVAIGNQSRKLSLLSGFIASTSAYANVYLIVLLWSQHDVVWSSCLIGFLAISTLFNLLVARYDHPQANRCLVWALVSVLQLKPIGDAWEYYAYPLLDISDKNAQQLLKDHRMKKYVSSVLHALPASFLLTYILFLNLEGRLSEHVLSAALALAFISFALGATSFAACNEGVGITLVVFIQVLAQFTFRMFAVAAVCVRFTHWGIIACGVMWVMAYLFGPQGTFPLWRFVLCGKKSYKSGGECLLLLSKVLVTPASFFTVLDIEYESPHHPDLPIRAFDCFNSTYFLVWRLIENTALVTSFVFLPPDDEIRDPHQYEEWLSHPHNVALVSGVSGLLIVLTWVIIACARRAPGSYQEQKDVETANTVTTTTSTGAWGSAMMT